MIIIFNYFNILFTLLLHTSTLPLHYLYNPLIYVNKFTVYRLYSCYIYYFFFQKKISFTLDFFWCSTINFILFFFVITFYYILLFVYLFKEIVSVQTTSAMLYESQCKVSDVKRLILTVTCTPFLFLILLSSLSSSLTLDNYQSNLHICLH